MWYLFQNNVKYNIGTYSLKSSTWAWQPICLETYFVSVDQIPKLIEFTACAKKAPLSCKGKKCNFRKFG